MKFLFIEIGMVKYEFGLLMVAESEMLGLDCAAVAISVFICAIMSFSVYLPGVMPMETLFCVLMNSVGLTHMKWIDVYVSTTNDDVTRGDSTIISQVSLYFWAK